MTFEHRPEGNKQRVESSKYVAVECDRQRKVEGKAPWCTVLEILQKPEDVVWPEGSDQWEELLEISQSNTQVRGGKRLSRA